jgi:hypothetical protein
MRKAAGPSKAGAGSVLLALLVALELPPKPLDAGGLPMPRALAAMMIVPLVRGLTRLRSQPSRNAEAVCAATSSRLRRRAEERRGAEGEAMASLLCGSQLEDGGAYPCSCC